jgi:hypothetical protein
MVPRTEGYTYDVGVWALSIVQGPFSVAPCHTFEFTIRQLLHRWITAMQNLRIVVLGFGTS